MKKIISFSLYGNKPNFQVGAVVNVLEAKRLYPDWKCRFYTTDNETICKQLEYLHAEVVRMDEWPEGKAFWRFLAMDDSDVCLFRDTDSVVNERELSAVNEWLETDGQWHIMHDHRQHRYPIMAGMCGFKKGQHIGFKKNSVKNYIHEWLGSRATETYHRTWDQDFLKDVILPMTKGNCLKHGNFGKPFPPHSSCRYGNFVGDYSFWANGWKEFVNGDNKKTQQENRHPKKHERILDRVIIACDSNKGYLDFWPLVSAAWEKIGVKPALVLIEKPDESIEVDESLGDILRIKLTDDSVHPTFAAQAVRLLAPALYPDENITIADIDIVPLSKEYFFENVKRGSQDSFIEFRSGSDNRVASDQIPICWNIAKGSIWSEIFKVNANFENYQDVFVNRLKEWYPASYRPIQEGKSIYWFTDQKLLFDHLSNWDGTRVRLVDSETGYCRLDHRVKKVAGMHDHFTDFCPRRPLNFFITPSFNNIHSIKHVADWYKIHWPYEDIWREAYSNSEYCVVTFCNKAYLDEAKLTIEGLRNQGRWAGEIVVMVGDDLKDETDLFDDKNVIVKYFPDIDRTKAIELYKTLPGGISDGREIYTPFQWHRIHCFQTFFKKWEKCLLVDAGMHIYNPIKKILDIDCGNNLLAHSDSYPSYKWRLSGQFNKTYFPELYEEISSKHDLNVDYFQTAFLMYNTSIINDNTFNEINSLQKKYLNSRTNEQAVLNLYFNLEKKMWKQLPFNKNSVPYYDSACRTGNNNDYVMTKR